MWIRLSAILLCIVFFITGCNSLISQFFGTHKLRHFDMENVLANGIEDADFVEIKNTWQTGDYIIVPKKNASDKVTLIYPILSDSQMEDLKLGKKVSPRIVAWQKMTSIACDSLKECAPKMKMNTLGIVREMRKQKNKAHLLPADKYELPGNVDYIEMGRTPLAWYWNVLMLVGGLGLAFFIESRANKARKLKEKE